MPAVSVTRPAGTVREESADMSSATDKFKGKIKEVAGKITGDQRLESEGRTEQAKAKVRETVRDVRERARGIRDSLRRGHP